MGFIAGLLESIPIPRFAGVTQKFDRPRIDDLAATFQKLIDASGVLESVFPQMKIALAVGSRGISKLIALSRIRPFAAPMRAA